MFHLPLTLTKVLGVFSFGLPNLVTLLIFASEIDKFFWTMDSTVLVSTPIWLGPVTSDKLKIKKFGFLQLRSSIFLNTKNVPSTMLYIMGINISVGVIFTIIRCTGSIHCSTFN